MDLKRRINLGKALDASTSAIKLNGLHAGSHYVTSENCRHTGNAAFIVRNGEDKDISVTIEHRWRR